MTDYPRFQPTKGGSSERCYREHHGAQCVSLVFRIADAWLRCRCSSQAPPISKENITKPLRRVVLAMCGLACVAAETTAQSWPERPVKAIVPFQAGSITDVVPRIVFEQLSQQLGQSFIVENRPGAGATIGPNLVAKANPDGYTILVNSSAHTIAPALYSKLGYDPRRDFAAVTPLGIVPSVLVVSSASGHSTAAAFAAAAKARPGAMNFASASVGTATHLSAVRFQLSAGVDAVHVPFKGGPEALSEVMAGRIDFFLAPLGVALPYVRDGRLTALAVNSFTRSAALPDVSTTREAGFSNAEYVFWIGMLAPANTSRVIIDKLHRETVKALGAPRVQEKLAALGIDPVTMTPGQFDEYVKKQIDADAQFVRATGIKAE